MTNIEIQKQINVELDKAEVLWGKVRPQLLEKGGQIGNIQNLEAIPTKIPGFPFLKDGKPEVANFICLVLDIRGSTNHLIQAISERTAKASQLERVLYETTAINTAGILIIGDGGGGITEFLGDGFLSLFKSDDSNKSSVYKAHNAAKRCLEVNQNIINPILSKRYSLPPLEIGIGMARSKAIVTLIGMEENFHPKAIGECVYRATKLSGIGRNEICVDDRLKYFWPTEEGGTLKFLRTSGVSEFEGYKIQK